MSFIQRELDAFGYALARKPDVIKHDRLYAAQQVLAWATEPNGFARPSVMITGIRGETGDCSHSPRLPPSSDICDHNGS
jgi:hypothetical protein